MFGLAEMGVLCMALNIYFESRGEPEYAQEAVALVTLNRSRKQGKPICAIVFEPNQFSWTLEYGNTPPSGNSIAWIKAQQIAERVSKGRVKDFTKGSRWFHRHDVYPQWRKNLEATGQWGDHIFYKEK